MNPVAARLFIASGAQPASRRARRRRQGRARHGMSTGWRDGQLLHEPTRRRATLCAASIAIQSLHRHAIAACSRDHPRRYRHADANLTTHAALPTASRRTASIASSTTNGATRRTRAWSICVHGVGRNGRDFDVLAEALAPTHRVLAVDMPGRGNSDWLADPDDYVFPTYLTTLTALIARSGADECRLGRHVDGRPARASSLAAQPKTPIRRLVVNDVGPQVEAAALARIGAYFGQDPTFAHLRRDRGVCSRDLGAVRAADRCAVGVHHPDQRAPACRRALGHRLRSRASPVPFRKAPAPPDLWPVWDAIRCPTLVLRGAESDLLSPAGGRHRWRRAVRGRG